MRAPKTSGREFLSVHLLLTEQEVPSFEPTTETDDVCPVAVGPLQPHSPVRSCMIGRRRGGFVAIIRWK